MWPTLLDMTKEESIQKLRSLELEAYASVVTALRAQGPLNQNKLKVLKEVSSLLNITQERHKAEIRRAVNDEKLNTIAYHVCGCNTYLDDWTQEGRWLVPLMHRATPQTMFSVIADDNADTANASNKQLPLPSMTERKRNQNQYGQGVAHTDGKSMSYRTNDNQKLEECRKRKFTLCSESSGLPQYTMGPPKISKIQQIYRQRTKARTKEQQQQSLYPLRIKQETEQKDLNQKKVFTSVQGTLASQTNVKLPSSSQPTSPKVNVLQNITMSSVKSEIKNEPLVDEENVEELERLSQQPSSSNENQVPKVQKSVVTAIKGNVIMKQGDINKSIKLCPRKTIARTASACQKVIVVTAAQQVPPSMLQRALTVPVVKNLEKFKIVSTTASTPTTLPIAAAKTSGANSIKHKVVTVRTNALPKKVSLSHLQFLNAKGSIKVLPFGGKIITKTTTLPTSNLIIVNSGEDKNAVKTVTSTSMILSTQSHESDTTNIENQIQEQPKDEPKSSVLEDILKASGVITADSESCEEETVNNQEILQAEPPFKIQEHIVEEITADEARQIEDNEELIELSVDSLGYEENTVEHNEDETCQMEQTYMIVGEENTDKIIQNDENSTNLDTATTEVDDVEDGTFEQCVINQEIVMCDDKMVCTKDSSED